MDPTVGLRADGKGLKDSLEGVWPHDGFILGSMVRGFRVLGCMFQGLGFRVVQGSSVKPFSLWVLL